MERVKLVAAEEIVQIVTVFDFQTGVLIDTAVQSHADSYTRQSFGPPYSEFRWCAGHLRV